ncbi:hypothetical protein lbkm_1913 [Lachnospiraceae bacterium KM106-2]|nr:hypothetical protein lbkm_1913 [Lachnospiraceae bacterium KM106-2]
MDKVEIRIQVLFETPFWIGIVEKREDSQIAVSKITFGEEPKDYEVYEYLMARFQTLRFSPWVEEAKVKQEHTNPKRIARSARKELKQTTIGTKSQQALALQREETKILRKKRSKDEKEAELERKFKLRQQKKKQKHKGR